MKYCFPSLDLEDMPMGFSVRNRFSGFHEEASKLCRTKMAELAIDCVWTLRLAFKEFLYELTAKGGGWAGVSRRPDGYWYDYCGRCGK